MCKYLSIYTCTGLRDMQCTKLCQAARWSNCGFDRRFRAHDNDERPIMQAVFCGISRICKNSKLDRMPVPIYLQLHIDVATHEGTLDQLTWKMFCSKGRVSRSFIQGALATKLCKMVFESLATFIMDLLIYVYIQESVNQWIRVD